MAEKLKMEQLDKPWSRSLLFDADRLIKLVGEILVLIVVDICIIL